jgi:hypothetical protein
MNLKQILIRILLSAKETTSFKRNKRVFGLSLVQYEECVTYVLMVLLGAKQAYLMSMRLDPGLGSDTNPNPERIIESDQRVLHPYCLHLLIETLQKQVEALNIPFVQIVCVCIPAEDPEHESDYIILQRSTLIRKIDELKRGLADKHLFIIDVSGTAPISVCPLKAVECLLKCFGTYADVRSSSMEIESVVPADLASLRNSVGVCLLAGFLLGYPVLYQCGQGARDLSSSVGNALSMQPLKKLTVTVPTFDFLKFGHDKCASNEFEPCLLRFCSGGSLTVFDFTIPMALIEDSTSSFDSALQAQLDLVRDVFGSVAMSSSVFIEPYVAL